MTDLDFEELDRAVNSAMSPKATKKNPSEDKASSINNGAESKKEDKPSAESKITIEEKSDLRRNESLKPKPRVNSRSSGRFMDVVHPSSDMKSNILRPESKQASSQSSTDKSTSSNPAPHEMPDPLDIHEKIDDLKSTSESPFLPNAKVEKRPLGAFSDTQTQKESEEKVVNEGESIEKDSDLVQKAELNEQEGVNDLFEDDAPYEPNPETRNIHLPPELQKDILDVESDPTTDKLNISTQKAASQTVPLGNPYLHTQTELTPQYSQKPSTEKSSGSIYDTKEYHSPLAHPAKKKSGWMIVVWILLIVSVAIGIAYYVSTYLFVQ